jgi:hypothetical protein
MSWYDSVDGLGTFVRCMQTLAVILGFLTVTTTGLRFWASGRRSKIQSEIHSQQVKTLRETVRTSTIKVRLVFSVSEDTRGEFNGTISGTVETCRLRTKSGQDVIYQSAPGSTRMIRTVRGYEFSFEAMLPSDATIDRERPLELRQPQEIVVPLVRFATLMKRRLSSEATCSLDASEVSLLVNGDPAATCVGPAGVQVNEGSVVRVSFEGQ